MASKLSYLLLSPLSLFILVILSPISSAMHPFFQVAVLLQQPIFLVSFYVALLPLLWLMNGSVSKVTAAFCAVVFAAVFFNMWIISAPNGEFLYSVPGGYAAVLAKVVASGRIPSSTSALSTPTIYILGSSVLNVSGLDLSQTLYILEFSRPLLWALFIFLVSGTYLKSYRAAGVSTALALIGTAQLSKFSPFNIQSFGFVFFLACFYLLEKPLRAGSKGSQLALLLAFGAAVLTYPLASFLLVFGMLSTRAGNFISRKRGKPIPQHNPRPTLLIAVVGLFVAWSVYTGYQIAFTGSLPALTAIYNLIFHVHGTVSANNTGIYQYLLTLVSFNISFLPLYLGILIPFWFVLVLGGGLVAWVASGVTLRKTIAPSLSLLFAVLATSLIFFFDSGGAGWFRVTPYIGLFASIALTNVVYSYSRSVKKSERYVNPFVIIVAIIFVLSLPTTLAYAPLMGQGSIHYSWQFASSSFLGTYSNATTILPFGSVPTTSFSLYERTLQLPLYGDQQSSFKALTSVLLGYMQSNHQYILVSDPFFKIGLQTALGRYHPYFIHSLNQAVMNSNVVYNNGWTNVNVLN